ncbi:hypothetical protein AV530_013362 [Patagioenas fasciata monilis]|uniref:Uncharacterized protein n=1 Tax=Patagioenas fasciata monilis TaxID=372326 RepID=A0A1V4JP73_PATFA|nr:hypothetical protein AV530_013362 [Patagioenas fasciata monilis]
MKSVYPATCFSCNINLLVLRPAATAFPNGTTYKIWKRCNTIADPLFIFPLLTLMNREFQKEARYKLYIGSDLEDNAL